MRGKRLPSMPKEQESGLTVISDDIAAAPRTGWKAHARAAVRNGDPWAAWAEMRHAPREQIEEASLHKSLDKLIGTLIERAATIEALGDLFRLAAESRNTGEGGRRTVGSIAGALAKLASDEELSAASAYAELMPLAMAPELHPTVLDVLLDVFEVLMGRSHIEDSREFLVAVLAGCRKRGYEDVSVNALERMIAFGDSLV